MTTSEQINELVTALAEARPEFKAFTKDQTAKVTSSKGSYTYQYGDKASLFDAVMPALNKRGVFLTQAPSLREDGKPVLVTMLTHKSGQWMRSEMPMHLYDRPQETGSELTYLSRYAAQLMLGVAGEADDDGASAQQGTQRQPLAAATTSTAQASRVPGTSTPTARPSAAPRALPNAKPTPKQAFVDALEKATTDPFADVPHPADITADQIPF
jgi:hypothetical protein